MSTTFEIFSHGAAPGEGPVEGQGGLNLATSHAEELLRWLGYEKAGDFVGELDARDLAARCRRRLWNHPRNQDPARPEQVRERLGRPTLVIPGRPAGYLRLRVEELLQLAERAGDRAIVYY